MPFIAPNKKSDVLAKKTDTEMLRQKLYSKITLTFAKQRGTIQSSFLNCTVSNVAAVARSLAVRMGLALAFLAFSVVTVAATTFTMAVPNTSLTLPTTYPQAGGVAIVLEGVNGNVYYQFVNPSTMFVGFQNTGVPAAWQGNPFQIGPAMALNCGPVVSCSSYLGGSISRMTVRFTAYDGDNQTGQFDFNNLNLQINGSNFGASSGNWSVVATQNTSLDGLTLISSSTGYGNNTFDTGWFQSTDSALLSNILTSGSITAHVLDSDPNDNFWDFARGSDANTAVVPLNVAPGVTLDKSSTVTSFTSVGEVIPYTFTIQNIGSVWLNSITVTDPKVSSVSCPAPPPATTANLDPGESIVCTANYTVTQADVDAGVINNTATVSGTPQAGTLGPVSDSNSIPGPAGAPSVVLSKTSLPTPSFGVVGTSVVYAFSVNNTGNVTLSNVVITDPLLPSLSCTVANIAPGATNTATCTNNTLTVTQAHVDSGSIANTATVTARAPSGATVSNISSVTLTGPAQVRSASLDKTSLTLNFDDVGDVLSYGYSIENTGNVTLTGVLSVSDDRTGVTCPALPGGLAPGAMVTCSASYTVTQSDLDAGQVVNTASATIGTTTSASDQVTVPAVQNPTVVVEKSSSTPSFNAVGDVLSYDYVLRNTGNVTLTGAVSVADDKTAVSCAALPVAGLAPLATLGCSASYTVTQADIDAGGVTNTATGTIGATTSPSDQVTVPAVQSRAMTVDKTATSVNFVNVGDSVSYDYVVTNTGNTTLTDPVTVSDNRIPSVNCPALPPGGLAPLATLTCTGTYTLVLADLDLGSVTNLATATSGATTSPSVSETIPAGVAPALTIAKTSGSTSFATVGELLPYSYVISNTGDASFTRAITVTDDKIAGPIACYTPTGADPTFTPGESVTCSASYGVTQADIDAGFVTNQAYGATTYGAANTPITSPPDSVTVNAAQAPALTVSKSTTTLPVTAVGQVLTYTIAVENSGNVTLSNIIVTDPLIPSLSCTIATLAPAATDSTCSGPYTVTQDNFDAGVINNSATADGITPLGIAVSDTATLSTPIENVNPGIEMSKTPSIGSYTSVGEVVNYNFTLRNSGDVTLSNITVTDPLVPAFNCVISSLPPGTSNSSCVASYTVQQSDIDAGTITNTASVSATPARGTPPFATASVTINGPARSAILTVDKQALATSYATVGDRIDYTFAVTNAGNVSVNGPVTINDSKLAIVTCPPVAPTGLLPGASLVCSGNYTVSQSDIDAGNITNTANASAATVLGPVTSAVDVHTVGATVGPAMTVVKSAGPATVNLGNSGTLVDAGDEIAYSFTVANTGNVTLSNLSISDAKIGAVSCSLLTLAPGANTQCAAVYTLTTNDIDSGAVTNTATGSATPPSGPPVSDVSGTAGNNDTPTVSVLPQTPSMTVVKSSSAPSVTAGANAAVTDAGDSIDYTFTIANTGNVSLVNVTLNDSKLATVNCLATSLAPAATTTCSGIYALTQADIDAGSVTNSALASGNPPTGPPVTDTSGTTAI